MSDKESILNKFIYVDMNDAQITTEEKTIIGTDSLATCIGVLLYSEDKRRAIVAHVAPDKLEITTKIAQLLVENDLVELPIKYKIISGYYDEHYNTKERLEKSFNCFIPFSEEEISDNAIIRNEKYTSCEFVFDASTGKFITEKDFFNNYHETMNQKRGR